MKTIVARRLQLRAMVVALLLAGCANRGMQSLPLELGGAGGDSQAGGAGGIPLGTGGGAGQIGSGGAATGGAATGGMAGKGGSGGAAGGSSTGGVTGAGGSAGAAGRGATGGVAGAGTGGAAGGAGGPGGRGGAAGAGGVGGGTAIPMLAYYPFDQTAGPVIADASGNGHNGAAQGTVAFATGQIGSALNLNNGTSGSNYVSLPANLLQGLNDLTITAWVWVRTDILWARVFDFGGSTTKYMHLVSHATGTGGVNAVRFAITTAGNGAAEQQLTGAAPLPVGTWTHVAVVLQGTSNGILYVNGTSVASSTSIPLRPSSLGPMPNDWIGHSEFAGDPSFDGEIDDFRIYARALTAADIQAIYTQR